MAFILADMDAGREKLSKRELVVRVATLELLVADLIHVLRQVAPDQLDVLADEARLDLDTQMARFMPAGAEEQRFRLRQVFDERLRSLVHRRSSRVAAARRSFADPQESSAGEAGAATT